MRFFTFLLFFLSLCMYSIAQRLSETDSVGLMCKADNWNADWKTNWRTSSKVSDYRLKTTSLYSETTSKGITIQNSYPKGGAYTDPNGQGFGYSMFWTRVINETTTPLEVIISFPAHTFAMLPSSDLYLKLFMPSDTMQFSKQVLYDYGVDVKSFLDMNFDMPTMLQKTINPNEESFLYIGALFNQANGVGRAELLLKGQDLFYRIIGLQSDPVLIPCGHIVFKE